MAKHEFLTQDSGCLGLCTHWLPHRTCLFWKHQQTVDKEIISVWIGFAIFSKASEVNVCFIHVSDQPLPSHMSSFAAKDTFDVFVWTCRAALSSISVWFLRVIVFLISLQGIGSFNSLGNTFNWPGISMWISESRLQSGVEGTDTGRSLHATVNLCVYSFMPTLWIRYHVLLKLWESASSTRLERLGIISVVPWLITGGLWASPISTVSVEAV